MNNCAESQTKYCRAFIGDMYSHLARALNQCKSDERDILIKNILSMLDKVKDKVNGN